MTTETTDPIGTYAMQAIAGSIALLAGAVLGAGAWSAESSASTLVGVVTGILLLIGFAAIMDGTLRGRSVPPK
jgi:hypothetical protein